MSKSDVSFVEIATITVTTTLLVKERVLFGRKCKTWWFQF